MQSEDLNEQLRANELLLNSNWQHLIYKLRRHLDIWAQRNVKPFWGNMKISYLPVIFNISIEGSTAAEISRKSMVSKQSMSRTIKELEEKGMIISEKNYSDLRSESLNLTDLGKKMILDANAEQLKMVELYERLVGKKNLAIAVDVLNQIIKYHEEIVDDKDDLHSHS